MGRTRPGAPGAIREPAADRRPESPVVGDGPNARRLGTTVTAERESRGWTGIEGPHLARSVTLPATQP